MQIRIDTTFSGKDISSAVSVYEYTIPASGTYRFQVRLAAVAGNGDYVAYLTLNDGDAQTDDIIEPRTTATLDSGQTTCWFATMSVDAIAGDVINVFLTGQAGDTSESGSIRIFSDNYSTLAVTDILSDSTAFAGANVANLDATVSSRSDGTGVTLAAGAITAAVVATGAIDADALATDAVSEIADGVWDEAQSGHTSAGTFGKYVDQQLTTLFTTALTESYASDGSAPTLAQAVYAIQQFLQERAVSGTTLTVKKLDGSTTAMTFTLDSATAPTSLTRAS